METWKASLIAVGSLIASLIAVFFSYRFAVSFAQMDEAFDRWVAEHGFRVIRHETQYSSSKAPFPYNAYCPTFSITVQDSQQRQKNGWIRLGSWYFLGFSEKIEVRWND